MASNPFSKLTDGEISVMVGRLEMPKHEVSINPHNPKGAQYVRANSPRNHGMGYFPVSHAADGFPIIARNRIALVPASKTTWEARHESGATARHKNPLRAGMIVYLMICDVQANGLSAENWVSQEKAH